MVIFSNSRGVLQQFRSVRINGALWREAEVAGWDDSMQWASSHCGIPGNERTYCFAAATHSEISSSTIYRLVEDCAFIRDSVLSLHPDVDVAHGFPPTAVPRQWITSAAATLLRRHHTDCAFIKRSILLIGRPHTPLCEACGVIEDVFHMLRSCPLYTSHRDVRENSIRSDDRPCTSLHHWFSPPGPPGSVRYVFGALRQLLELLGFAIRLQTYCRR